MDLLRHWRRGTFGAATGALALPFALFAAALAVGLGGGGLGALGGFGQIVSGPDAPVTTPLSDSRPARDAGRLLASVRTRPPAAGANTGGGSGGTRVVSQGSDGGGSGSAPTAGIEQPNRPGGGGGTPSTPTAPATPAAPAPTPAPAGGPVRQVTDTVKTVTDQLPVVATPVGQVLDDAADTIDSLVKP